jgi:hypothetical protein
MNARSAGVASTWADHESLTSCSESDNSENEITPRASGNHSSIDLSEFDPQPLATQTLAQRLFKFGTRAKVKDVTRPKSSRDDTEPQTIKKRKGLRKSMSVWNLHSDKKKAASQVDLSSTSPHKVAVPHAQANELDLLNERKRRAEEAYAKQFGTKKRKSDAGIADSQDQSPEKSSVTTRTHTADAANSSTVKRRLSWSSTSTATADAETVPGVTNIDLHKRPSRRELEKQNQELRDLLRQQQEKARSAAKNSRSASAGPRNVSKSPENARRADASPSSKNITRKPSGERLQSSSSSVPVVASSDRAALRPLNNTRNIPQKKTSHEDLKTINEDVPERGRSLTTEKSTKASAKHSRRASTARGVEVPRSVSVIFEQDEEFEIETGNATTAQDSAKENLHPLKNIPKLMPTPAGSPNRITVHEDRCDAVQDVQREKWEWPDDVF